MRGLRMETVDGHEREGAVLLPVCKRAEYERMMRGEKEPDHEEKAPDD